MEVTQIFGLFDWKFELKFSLNETHLAGRFELGGSGRMCLVTGIPLASGGRPPGFNPLRRGWVYRPASEAPRKRECRQGPRHFWDCRTCLGYGPATGPTLKTALCYTCTLVGRMTNIDSKWRALSVWLQRRTHMIDHCLDLILPLRRYQYYNYFLYFYTRTNKPVFLLFLPNVLSILYHSE